MTLYPFKKKKITLIYNQEVFKKYYTDSQQKNFELPFTHS